VEINKVRMKIVAFFCMIFIWQSCCKKVPFSQSDKFWFDCYVENSKAIFKSNFNDFDTMVIISKVVNVPDGKCNRLVGEYDQAHANVQYEIKKDSFETDRNYLVQLTQKPGGNKTYPVIRFLNMEFSEYELGVRDLNLRVCPIIGSNFTVVDSCFVFNSENCGMNYGQPFGLQEIFWSKQYGMISYKNSKGEVWLLYKIIPPQ